MNQNALNCPTQLQLMAFVTGKLNVTESAEIEQHLADCESCCQSLKMLPDNDTLVSLLRAPQADTADDNRRSPRFAPTLPPVGERLTLPPGGPTEIADATAKDGALSLPESLRDHSRYRVTQLLGRGGMGDVYEAHHRMMNRSVALKVINSQLVNSHAAVQRFHREVQAAARLTHPNIVTAFDAEQAGDTHFLVMEFVDGVELAEVIKDRGPLPVAEACDYVRQAAVGLQHAHEQGMVHRDIKPQNLMLTCTGGVKILDFGLANLAGAAAEEVIQHESDCTTSSMLERHLTQLGSMMGTPDYMAPEQADDAHRADIRADIYSLGCTLYCLLSGKAPFSEGSVTDKVQSHKQHTARPLAEFRGDVPVELDAVISRMMHKSPDERFQTPIEVARALEPFLASPADLKTQLQARRSIVMPLAIAATLLLGFFIASAAVIVVVTNQGRMEFQSEVDDVQVVVEQNGEQFAIIDLKTGSQVKWLPTGKYELKLVGGDNDVMLDQHGFTMSRLGKIVVTARWNTEGRGTLANFNPPAEPITQDGVGVADGGWKITAADTRTVRLFEAPMPELKPGPFFYRAKLKTENVAGRAYLEMWVRFPGEGEFFSKDFHNAVSGTNGWAEYEVPFFLKKGQQPDLAKLNLTIEGSGTVWIKDIQLHGRQAATPEESADGASVGGEIPEATLTWIDGDYARPTDILSSDQSDHITGVFEGAPLNGSPFGPTEREVLKAAEAYLAVIDEGRFGALRDMVSSMAKQQVTREQVSQTYQKLRDTFGKATRRTLQRVQVYDEFPGLPAGRYAGVSYKTDFERQAGWWESLLLNVDTDGQWRVNTYANTLEPMPFPEAKQDPAVERKKQAARSAAQEWLKLVDAGQFGEAWEACAEIARKGDSKTNVVEGYNELFQPLGKLQSREFKSSDYTTQMPRAAVGEYTVVQFRSRFTNGRIIETVILMLESDGQWRVAGYRHAEDDSNLTPPPPALKPTPPQQRTGLLTNPPKLPQGGLPVGKNLIIDSSLEDTPTGQLPKGWFAWLDDGPDFKCEVVEGGITGKHCLQISGTGTRGVVFATSIPMDRTKRYALKGRVKVEGEAGTWAVIKLNYFNNTGWLGVDDRIGVTTSDLDWKLFEKTDVAEQYPAATLIVPTCHIEGNGTAWFDDLEVIAYDREKLPENFDATHGRSNRMK